MNQEDLERKITIEQAILHKYEEDLRLEDDLRQKHKLQAEIEKTRIFILGLEAKLTQQRTTAAPERDIARQGSSLIINVPYELETELVGRKKERRLLDDWFRHDPAHPFLAVIGLGGQGKSALAWDWLKRLRWAREAPPLVVWWSFYHVDGTLDEMMTNVLPYFGEERSQFPNLRAAVNQFINHLWRTPALIVLDGAERLLRAYSGLGAAYQGDEWRVAGGEWRGARQCVDPVMGTLLAWLAQPGLTQATTLMTSRLFPQELAGRGGFRLAGVRRHDLTGLAPEAAYQMFVGLDVHCTRAEVAAVCEPLGYHPLSLRLLARYAAYDPTTPKDLRAAIAYDPSANLLGKRQHVLARAYDTLPATAQLLLSHLAAFRSIVPWETITKVFGSDDKVRDDLNLLRKRGLLQQIRRHGSQSSYDLHPIVRRYAYKKLNDKVATHTKLVTYFLNTLPGPKRAQSLPDLAPIIDSIVVI